MRATALTLLVLSVGAWGCEGQDGGGLLPRRDTRTVADVVARVNGRPIGAGDVAARMSKHDVDAQTALEALIEEEVLLREAHRRGVTLSPEARRRVERTMVRAMLRDFEEGLTPESISAREVRAEFEAHEDKMQIPERRRSWHILVKGNDEGARDVASSILEEVGAAEAPRDVFERYATGRAAERDVEVKAEELPPISKRANIEKGYKDALFEQKATGLITKVVETSYGFHVIALTEIVPAERRTLEDVEEEIRDRLSQKKRFEELLSTVRALEAEGLVEYDEETVQHLLSASKWPQRAD